MGLTSAIERFRYFRNGNREGKTCRSAKLEYLIFYVNSIIYIYTLYICIYIYIYIYIHICNIFLLFKKIEKFAELLLPVYALKDVCWDLFILVL